MSKKVFVPCFGFILLITLSLTGCQGQPRANDPIVLLINEVMASNGETIADNDGDFEDWLEIYNPGEKIINLAGYYLSDKEDNLTKWKFPEVAIEAGEYLIIWASGKDKLENNEIHTNFSISASGETLILTLPDGQTIVDQLDPIAIPRDWSYGRYPDGAESWHFYQAEQTSPGSANPEPLDEIEAPSFSQNSGFFQEEFALELQTDVGAIYYTLDGSEPDPVHNAERTIIYSEPLKISDRSQSPNNLAKIPTIGAEIRHKFQAPSKNIFKATVVRAKSIEGQLSSRTVTQTYFITEEGIDRYTLPVFSLATDPHNLFDPDSGIYVGGNIFEEYLRNNPTLEKISALAPANYHQRGKDWERPLAPWDSISLEYFNEQGKLVLSQNIGLRIHGGASRAEPQKSLRIYAREGFGKGSLQYPFFRDHIDNYQRIILRNAGNEWGKTMFLDAYAHSLLGDFKVDIQKYQPTILFINGEYWGIHNLRERQDEYYLAARYDLEPEKVTILENNELSEGTRGDEQHYFDLLAFVENNDLAIRRNYDFVQTQMDIENFIDYQIINIFFANIDWPQNNLRLWRYNTDKYDPNAPLGKDGRWRWLVYDLDSLGGTYGAGFWDSGERYADFDALSRAIDPNFYTEEGPWPTLLLRSLLKNTEFKTMFIERFDQALEQSFDPTITLKKLNEFKERIRPEIEEHLQRWGYPASVQEWEEKIDYLDRFMQERPAYQRQELERIFFTTKDK